MIRATALLLLLAYSASAQEFSRAVSPDGQLIFTLDVDQPQIDASTLPGLAYQVKYKGQLLIDTSYLGFDVWAQEPMLGEKVGLSLAKNTSGTGFNAVYAEYLQQGSLGRRIHIEARVFNNGIAFRYIVPPSPPLMDIFFRDEITEYRFAKEVRGLRDISAEVDLEPPYAVEVPGVGWVSIQEADVEKPFTLRHYEGNKLVTRLPKLPDDPQFVVKSHPTWTSSWRVLLVGPTAESVRAASFIGELPRR
jgi:alpha-glucosidase